MLYEYLIKNYKETEPIFFSDIPLMDKPKPEISRELRILCEEGWVCAGAAWGAGIGDR